MNNQQRRELANRVDNKVHGMCLKRDFSITNTELLILALDEMGLLKDGQEKPCANCENNGWECGSCKWNHRDNFSTEKREE